ncbi:hypothetical protein [Luteococcus peritonei]|uniref:Nuclear transport factor 2 family protein n=1 Tax=Luteococcus peritonei TaxID=88874 RepID=A0ABW4RTV8_9ACTN
MGGRWTKVVVVVLGIALLATFGLSALGGQVAQTADRTDVTPLLRTYDANSAQYWNTGSCDDPVVAQTLKASREAFDGYALGAVRVVSTEQETSTDDGRIRVRAEVRTSWTVSDGSASKDGGSVDVHQLVFDQGTGRLVSDDFVQ